MLLSVPVWFFCGTLSFGFLVLFEYQKCRNIHRGNCFDKNPWFLIGTGMLIISCVMLGVSSGPVGGIPCFVGLFLLCVGLVFYWKVLAVAKPEGYIQDHSKMPVSRHGLYGQMRHPGVWSFLVCAIGYGLIFPKVMMPVLWFAFLNLIYTWTQDRFFFPVYLEGYEDYKKEVPYLWPKYIRIKK